MTCMAFYLHKDRLMFGNKSFDVDEADNITIDCVWYADTRGLYELIFKRIPDDLLYYTQKTICTSTRACCWRRTRTNISSIRRVEY